MDIQLYKYQSDGSVAWIGALDDFVEFSFERSFFEIGEFDLSVNPLSDNAARLLNADFIRYGAKKAGIILQRNWEYPKNGAPTLTVTGKELKALASRRIVYPPVDTGYLTMTGATHEAIAAQLIQTQIISPTDSGRRVAGSLASYTPGSLTDDLKARFDNVAQLVIQHATAGGFGWFADISAGSIVWSILHGTNRGSAGDRQCIWSLGRDSFKNLSIEQLFAMPNIAFVAGKGKDTSRQTATVGNTTGLRRMEAFVDARDKDAQADLPGTGQAALDEYGDAVTITAQLSALEQSRLGAEYDLGDIVIVQGVAAGADIDLRLSTVIETYDEDGYTVEVELGTAKKTLKDSMRRANNPVNALLKIEVDS